MWGIFYNELFNVLMVTKSSQPNIEVETKEKITLIKDTQCQEIISFNLFDVNPELGLYQGYNSFNPKAIDYIQTQVKDFLDFKQESQFVIGYVEECDPIPNTHLHKTKVRVNNNKLLTIVCGANNILQGQYVVVALIGAWMPNGSQILPGKLYGIESEGMITSASELNLKNHPFNKSGIISLPMKYQHDVGQDFFTVYEQRKGAK